MKWLALFLVLAACPGRARADIRPGDVVFQTSRSAQGTVIREVTGSPWTHVGLVLERGGQLAVLEAVSPVRWTPLDDWRRRGGGDVLVRRPETALTRMELSRLQAAGEALVGRAYDARFEWGDARLYCSELVFLVFERAIGLRLVEPQRWRDLELGPRGRALARRRLGRQPDPDGLVVTPAALLRSPHLRAASPGP